MSTTIRQLFVFSILIYCTTTLYSQIYLDNEALFNEAEEYLEGEEYEEALPLYLMLESKGYTSSNINYKIGSCYLQILGQKEKALPYLERAVENISEDYPSSLSEESAPMEAYMLLGRSYHIQGMFSKAIESFQTLQKNTTDSSLMQLAGFYESRSYNASIMTDYPTDSKLTTLSAPTNFPVYNVIGASDGNLLFMEKRKFYDAVVQVNFQGDSLFNLQNLTPEIGSDGDYLVCGGSSNGKTLFFVGYDPNNGDELYYSEKGSAGEYSKLKKMPQPINSKFNETSAFLLNDNTIYFSSNRLGGVGGLDVYKSTLLENGEWSEPENLGESVNTGFNETAPFILNESDKIYLIFSSQGHLGMGGYDFFYSQIDSRGVTAQAKNMGSPFSTVDDDLYLTSIYTPNDFYTSRVVGIEEAQSSIVKLQLLEKLGKIKVMVKGQLKFNDSLPLKPVPFKVVDKTTSTTVIKSVSSDKGDYAFMVEKGVYEIEFEYNESVTARKEFSVVENSLLSEYYLSELLWATNPSEIKSETVESEHLRLYIRDILFDFDKYNLSASYISMLDSLSQVLINDRQAELTIKAYTDNIGSEKYNLWLSEQRAKAIYSYFISKGVSANQLINRALGESNPVAKNIQEDGSDYPQGRKFNRRVVLKLKSTSGEIKIIYLNIVPEDLKLK